MDAPRGVDAGRRRGEHRALRARGDERLHRVHVGDSRPSVLRRREHRHRDFTSDGFRDSRVGREDEICPLFRGDQRGVLVLDAARDDAGCGAQGFTRDDDGNAVVGEDDTVALRRCGDIGSICDEQRGSSSEGFFERECGVEELAGGGVAGIVGEDDGGGAGCDRGFEGRECVGVVAVDEGWGDGEDEAWDADLPAGLGGEDGLAVVVVG